MPIEGRRLIDIHHRTENPLAPDRTVCSLALDVRKTYHFPDLDRVQFLVLYGFVSNSPN